MSVREESTTSCACAAAPSPKRHIAWDIGELLIGYCLILAVIWDAAASPTLALRHRSRMVHRFHLPLL